MEGLSIPDGVPGGAFEYSSQRSAAFSARAQRHDLVRGSARNVQGNPGRPGIGLPDAAGMFGHSNDLENLFADFHLLPDGILIPEQLEGGFRVQHDHGLSMIAPAQRPPRRELLGIHAVPVAVDLVEGNAPLVLFFRIQGHAAPGSVQAHRRKGVVQILLHLFQNLLRVLTGRCKRVLADLRPVVQACQPGDDQQDSHRAEDGHPILSVHISFLSFLRSS